MANTKTKSDPIKNVIEIAHFCATQGWVPATSGNFSARYDDQSLAITVSGKDKGSLTAEEVMLIDFEGNSLDEKRPSAETLLHTQLYKRFPEIEIIAHIHSTASMALSKLCYEKGLKGIILEDWELLKALSHVNTHKHKEEIPIFENNQNIIELAIEIEHYIQKKPSECGFHSYLIAGHGLYTWGRNRAEIKRHIEAINSLLDAYLLEAKLTGVFQ